MLVSKLRSLMSNQLIRNASWLGGAELVNRVFRLVTTVILARIFSSHDYGLAAIIYTINEFASVFTLRYGLGAKIIQASEQDVETVCDTSYCLNWILCIVIFLIQCIAAFPIAFFYGDNQLILPICAVAVNYLMLPIFMVQAALIQRENRLKITALCNAVQAMVSNIATAILALLGTGIWAIVIPMILVNPVWIVISYMNHPWRPRKSFSIKQWQEIVRFGSSMLGVDLLNKVRGNLDYLLVGRILGIEALGIYYFAFNAGLGISMNVISAFMASLFPHLCAVRESYKQLKERYISSLKMVGTVIAPIIILQASLAPFYVPIVFGAKWLTAVPILVMICLSALPRAFAWSAALLLDSVGKAHITLLFDLTFTLIFAIALLVSVKWGIYWVAAAVLISHVVGMPIYTVVATKYVFNKSFKLSSK